VLCQDHPHRFAANLVDHSAFDSLLGEQTNGPSSATLGRRTAHQCNQRRLLRAVQLGLAARSRLFTEGVLEPVI
jgi:hypothetical protein